MNTIKEISPCFDKLASVTDEKEFIQGFCIKTLELFEEFKSEYSKAIVAQQISGLDAITHKISATMKWLELDEFHSLTKSYKDFTVSDQTKLNKLFGEVMYHTNMIEDSIQSKLRQL